MTAPKTAFEVRHRANEPSRLGEPMTVIERIAYESIKQIASEGRQATQPELCAATGVTYQHGTLPAILRRLEKKGYITRTVYQRGMTVCITATGQCTAQPKDTSPHWRKRTDRVPAPAIQAVSQRAKPLASMIEAKARSLSKPLHEFLMDCVYVGFHEIMLDAE